MIDVRKLSKARVWMPLGKMLALVDFDEAGCWIWRGRRNSCGYGAFTLRGRDGESGKTGYYTHRAMYEIFVGPIARGMQIDHLCRVTACCNPRHLEQVTPRENTLRSNAITAKLAARTECPHGHPLTPDNTRVRRDGARVCITCSRAAGARYRLRNSLLPAKEAATVREEAGR